MVGLTSCLLALMGALHAAAAVGGADAEPAADPAPTVTVAVGTATRALAPSPARPPGAPPPPRPAAVRATRAGLVLELRSDFGFERLVLVEFTNDRRASMNLNDGLGLSVGMSFLPLARGRLVTRVTAGLKAARLRASNGSALFTAFPVELMEAAYLGPLRVGAGLSVLLQPRVTGEDAFDSSRVSFDPAPGGVVDAEWLLSDRGRTGVGVRVSWHRFASRGTSRGAPAVGLVVRADFDLTGGR